MNQPSQPQHDDVLDQYWRTLIGERPQASPQEDANQVGDFAALLHDLNDARQLLLEDSTRHPMNPQDTLPFMAPLAVEQAKRWAAMN